MAGQNVVVAPPEGRAYLEPIGQPLYSAVALDAAVLPRELSFFSYGLGQTVVGAGTGAVISNPLHTNLLTARQLSSPKTFLVQEVSVHWPEVAPPQAAAAAAIEGSVGTTFVNSDSLDDLLLAWFTGVFSLTIGGLKDYIECPLPLVPQNTGIVGFGGREATLATTNFERSETFHPCGDPFRLTPNEVFIPSLQDFEAKVEWLQTTRATMLRTHLVYCFLDGRQGREIL